MVVLLDGGMGSTLEDRGVNVNNPLWGSVALLTPEGRALNDQVHREFAEAGADILIANTHNLSLAHCGDVERMRMLHERALESARRAAPSLVVAGCLASPDRPYSTSPSLSADDVAAAIRPQMNAIASLDFDVVYFEMMTTRADIKGVARVSAELDKPFAVGVPCEIDGRSLGGVSFDEIVDSFGDDQPEVYYVQCTRFDLVPRALEQLRAYAPGAIGVYANDGRQWIEGCWHGPRTSPSTYADGAAQWIAGGATYIGGCCGTGPEHIAELARRFK